MDIVHVSAEILPWSKAGGLGDVSGALPPALAARGHRVVTVAPRYADYPDVEPTPWTSGAWLYGGHQEIRWYHRRKDGVDHLFVDHPSFHRDGIYGDARGGYGDNLFRYALMCRAALDVPELPLDGRPLGDEVVWHANDWHASLVPLLLDAVSRPAGRFRRSPSILALHNVAHHGTEDAAHFPALDLAPRWQATMSLEGRLNLLHGGVSTADQLVTVSPTYAREITEDRGEGLESLLGARAGDLHGIVNGVGPEWDPATDPRLPARYDLDDLAGKAVCKRVLQERFGLPVADVPVLGFIGRLVHQKGVDLLAAVLPWLLSRDVQVVLLGSGDSTWEGWMRDLAARHPDKVGTFVGYDEDRAHLLTAGADLFLMPSRFEPCGLNQLYALRYGTVPLVHATGGLNDTVEPVDYARESGVGYRFWPFAVEPFRGALAAAIDLYTDDPARWRRLQRRGMEQRFDWDRAAEAYEGVYERSRSRRLWLAGPDRAAETARGYNGGLSEGR